MGKHPLLLIIVLLFLIGCNREKADYGMSNGIAVFSLQGNPGCSGAVANGYYALGVYLNGANSVPIQVNVTEPGAFYISTSYQGMTFSKTGSFNTKGVNTVILMGSGSPTTAGVNNVPLTVGNTNCSFQVNVAAAASYIIFCSSIVELGAYFINLPLDGSNNVTLSVNVMTPGNYNLTIGPVNGMTFSSGPLIFTSTGTNQIVLRGSGTPVTTGSFTFTLPGPCPFTIDVAP